MNVLELFSGTHSVGKVCDKLGWESVSVDMILPATHKEDIMNFNYKQYPKDHFDIIWASPPCVEYSNLQSCWLGRKKKDGQIYTKEIMEHNMNEADKLVLKTLEIIDYFNCEYWFMENPQTGRLKNRDIMKGIPFYDVDYCMYSDWGYQKRTRIWTNKKEFHNKLCDKSGQCGNMTDGKSHKLNVAKDVHTIGEAKENGGKVHKARMGTSKTIIDNGQMIRVNTAELRIKYKDYENVNETLNNETTQLDRYRIPEELIFSLFSD